MSHGGKLCARALREAGVGAIFTLTGGHVMPIYDGALDEGIPIIDVRHEQAAVHAADAYSRLNPGRIGCAVLTAGPGVTDGVTGIANAWRANSPILVIGGQGPFSNLRRGSLQEMDHVGMVRPISKWADACFQTHRIPEYVEMAVRTAVSGVPGPAFLEIPMDVLMAPASLEETRFPAVRTTPPTVHPFVLAGAPLDFRLRFGDSVPADARIVQFDMDATLIGQNRQADVGVVGNIGTSLDHLTDLLAAGGGLDFGTWSDELRAGEDEAAAALEAQLTSDESPVDPLRFAAEIRDFIDEDTILIGDGGDIVAQSSKVIPVLRENCWMDPGPLGTLGVGMPFALAAQHSFPDRRVLIIYGDGAFGLNGFEYDTAVRFGLPIVGIVGNDAAWGQMLRPQVGIYGADRKVAVDLAPTRYDRVVEAMGGHGEHCERPEEIRPALERAFASGKPALVNVALRKDEGAPKGSTYV